MDPSTTSRNAIRSAIGIAVLTLAALATTGVAHAGRAATAVGSETWGTNNCLYIWNGAGWAVGSYCRIFPIAGNRAVWDMHSSSDAQRRALARVDVSRAGWVYWYDYTARTQHAYPYQGRLLYSDPNRLVTLHNNQWLTNSQLQSQAQILQSLNALNQTLGQQVRQAQAAQSSSRGNSGAPGPAPGRRTPCMGGRYIAYNVCENVPSNDSVRTAEERRYMAGVIDRIVVDGVGGSGAAITRSACESRLASERNKYSDDLEKFKRGQANTDPRRSGFPLYACP